MFFLIISYILIILGFVFLFMRRKLKKNDERLKVAKIMNVIKAQDNTYEITVQYSFDDGATYLTDTFESKQKQFVKEEIIIKVLEDGTVEPYKGGRELLFVSTGCWIIGMLIICLLCK